MITLPDKLMNNKDYGKEVHYTKHWDCAICKHHIVGQNDVNVEKRALVHVKKKHYDAYLEIKDKGLIK